MDGDETFDATVGQADVVATLLLQEALDKAEVIRLVVDEQDIAEGAIDVEAIQGFEQVILEEGFGEVADGAEAEAFFLIFDDGADDDGDMAGGRVGLEGAENLPAIDAGHHDVEGDGKGLCAGGDRDGLGGVEDGDDAVAMIDEVALVKVEHGAVIIDGEDELAEGMWPLRRG